MYIDIGKPERMNFSSDLLVTIIIRLLVFSLRFLDHVCGIRFRMLFCPRRLGHLALNTDLLLRRRQLYPEERRRRYILLTCSTANDQLLTMFRRQIPIWRCDRVLNAYLKYRKRLPKDETFTPLPFHNNEYKLFSEGRASLTFTEEEEAKGREGLKELGIDPDNSWFVCIFARDDAYMKKCHSYMDGSYHSDRNADIDTFVRAVKYIVRKGGYVVRMGHVVEKPLSFKHEKVIDYAVSGRSEFMDVYLTAKCRFFLGTSSGIMNLANIFNVPCVYVNFVPMGTVPPYKNTIYIPKKVRHIEKKCEIPFYCLIDIAKDDSQIYFSSYTHSVGLEYIDNDEKDILEATVEMDRRLNGDFSYSPEDQELMDRYHALFPEDHWIGEAGRSVPIGIDFLRKNRFLLEKP